MESHPPICPECSPKLRRFDVVIGLAITAVGVLIISGVLAASVAKTTRRFSDNKHFDDTRAAVALERIAGHLTRNRIADDKSVHELSEASIASASDKCGDLTDHVLRHDVALPWPSLLSSPGPTKTARAGDCKK